MSSIKLTADSGGGTFEIKAPSSSGNTRVLTLPDTGNLTLHGGRILQVVTAVKTDTFTTSASISSPAAVTGLSCSITPAATTSKILIMANVGQSSATNGDYAARFHLYKAGSEISGAKGDARGSRTRMAFAARHSNSGRYSSQSMTYIDTAGGTSAITYQLYMSVEPSGGNACLNISGNDSDQEAFSTTISTFTVMEIAA